MPQSIFDYRLRARLLLHGTIVLFVGLLSGAPYNAALTRRWGDEAVRAWNLAHLAGPMCGIMAISISSVLHHLVLDRLKAWVMVWSLIASIYGFTVGMQLAALCHVRGLVPSKSLVDQIVNLAYQIGAWGALLGGAIMIVGAALASRSPRSGGS